MWRLARNLCSRCGRGSPAPERSLCAISPARAAGMTGRTSGGAVDANALARYQVTVGDVVAVEVDGTFVAGGKVEARRVAAEPSHAQISTSPARQPIM